MLILNLVSEHVDELYASCFQNWHVIDILSLSNLKFWNHQLLEIIQKQVLVNEQLCCAMSISVAGNTCCDYEVQKGNLLLPLLCFVLFIFLLELCEKFTNESTNFVLEFFSQLLHKLHALASSCLRVRLFKIIFKIHVRFIFILIDILLS